MRIEKARYERMSQSGSAILRLFQNHEMPVLDLFVREVVQNSLDAGIEGEGFVQVQFINRKFKSSELSVELEGISDKLYMRYGNMNADALIVRDSNTVGLTGPIRDSDVVDMKVGNFRKLVYEISKPQDQEGAGGSWGLGKTIYYRLGVGIVLYYTRIRSGSRYESRLAACLVENENDPERLIISDSPLNNRGIAWWGNDDGSGKTEPITDEREISRILAIFDLEPYGGSETGTTIIIPYVEEDKLLSRTVDSSETAQYTQSFWWDETIGDYIAIALQKWYCPRLNNKKYRFGRWLKAMVNDREINYTEFEPLFMLIQELYNKSDYVRPGPSHSVILENSLWNKRDIRLNSVFENDPVAGQIMFAKISSAKLRMLPPDNCRNPFEYLGKDFNGDSNVPIISFTRKPGMVVGYETSGDWVDGIQKSDPNEYIVGVFVPNSNNKLRTDSYNFPNLEEYLRATEKADHAAWSDVVQGGRRITIVDRIRKNLKGEISKEYNIVENRTNGGMNYGLSKSIASMILPPQGIGTAPTRSFGSSDRETNLSKNNSKHSIRKLYNPIFSEEGIKIPFSLMTGTQEKNLIFHICVDTESGGVHASSWEKEIGTAFPIGILEFGINKIKSGRKEYLPNGEAVLTQESDARLIAGANYEILSTKKFNVPYGISIMNTTDSYMLVEGYFLIQESGPKYTARFILEALKE